MPKIVTNDRGDGAVFEVGANHIWVAGVEVFSAVYNPNGHKNGISWHAISIPVEVVL
jgi:hypothetical protein